MIHENLFPSTNQDSAIDFTWENSKMFNKTAKYFSIFNNKPPVSWVPHITRNFLRCYSCSYYSSIFCQMRIRWLQHLRRSSLWQELRLKAIFENFCRTEFVLVRYQAFGSFSDKILFHNYVIDSFFPKLRLNWTRWQFVASN